MQNIQAVILAAGKSKRFKTGKSKLVSSICGQEMAVYAAKLLESMHIPTTMVVGYAREEVQKAVKEQVPQVSFVVQEEQLGTGHAVRCTQAVWQADHVLIMNGDVPLVTKEIIQSLYEAHQQSNALLSMIVAHHPEPSASYGRVIKDSQNIRVVEAHEFTGDPVEDCCINAGIYLIRRTFLEQHINDIEKSSQKQEFYLIDLVPLASEQGRVELVTAPLERVCGINTLKELWAAEQIQRADLINHWMANGVRFNFPQFVHIDLNVSIGAGTEIGAGVQLRNGTIIGSECTIGDFSILEKVVIADDVVIHSHSVLNDARLETGVQVGPFAHLHNQTIVGAHSVVGNFLEVKKSIIGAHTKAKHLSYLGDAIIGDSVNIGAGTIVCNHNGVAKNTTTINDNAYIGSDTVLVAPVTVGKGAMTAAGSTITQDVPAESLAIGRSRQTNKDGYVRKLRDRLKMKEEIPFLAAIKSKSEMAQE